MNNYCVLRLRHNIAIDWHNNKYPGHLDVLLEDIINDIKEAWNYGCYMWNVLLYFKTYVYSMFSSWQCIHMRK